MRSIVLFFFIALLAGMNSPAMAGTTTIDFTQDLGNLVQLGGSGSLSLDANCYAVFSGTPTYVIGSDGTPVTSSGVTSITMHVTPGTDVEGGTPGIGLVFIDASTGDWVMAIVNNFGQITIQNNLDSRMPSVTMPAPGAGNAAFTFSYDTNTDVAQVTVAGFSAYAQLTSAFWGGNVSVQTGVLALGPGKFRELSATGAGIPDYDGTGICDNGDVEGELEGEGEIEGEEEPPDSVYIVGTSRVEEGSNVALTLFTTLDGDITIQWYKDDMPLVDGNAFTYSMYEITDDAAGVYHVVVTDAGNVPHTSAPFLLQVVPEGSLPAGALLSLGILAGLLSSASAYTLRRRKHA